MNIKDELKAAVISLSENDQNFERVALEIFKFQAEQNPIYKAYLKNLGVKPSKVSHLEKIPCLPISFFKTHAVLSGTATIQHTFESSGTTGDVSSKHHIADLPFYEYLSAKTFETFYGPISDYHILALLPNYLERNNSSLVYMVQSFIYKSFSTESGFYLDNIEALAKKIEQLVNQKGNKKKVLLLGVTFALLDLIEKHAPNIQVPENLLIMETGGMKGKRKELLREEVHELLKAAFKTEKIHSEYGMTELLSQAYSKGDGWFKPSATMKILIREVNDPFSYLPSFKLGSKTAAKRNYKKTGGINVIDLANIDSCCFIETQDLGNFSEDYQEFKVLGRFDNSDVRGCNLMTI
ncbi:acyl transferase [uncultured Arcticibacterium sp.]|uniref:LuxE/PaaK family acyltransferase n=1 Tax=uncultured Arcticibacterium sp. TaxID=2173042 RepID=UPI0030F5048E